MTWALVAFLCWSRYAPLADCAAVRVKMDGVGSYMQCRAAITALVRSVAKPWEFRMAECAEDR